MIVSRIAQAAAMLLLLALGAVLFAPSLRGYFLSDDFGWVVDLYQKDWSYLPSTFVGDWSRGGYEYRPLWAASILTDLRLWGINPLALHVTNVILHLIACALVWRLGAHAITGGAMAGLLSLAFFVTAPIHEEPVAWIAARGHIIVAIFALGAVLLLRRFRATRELRYYLGSLACLVGAYATQEMAIIVPGLLLLDDFVGQRWSHGSSFVRRVAAHVPVWILEGLYLGMRLVMFGRIAPDTTDRTPLKIVSDIIQAGRDLLVSSTALLDVPRAVTWGVAIAIIVTLGLPMVFLRGRAFVEYVRAATCFGVGWVVIATVPIISGWGSQRHFYLASVGLAVALGLAGTRLMSLQRCWLVLAAGLVAGLLCFQALSLSRGVQAFASNGLLSQQLTLELHNTFQMAAADGDSVVVLLPDLPDWRRHFWRYALPTALFPPFGSVPPTTFIGSFASCACSREEWIRAYGATFDHLLAADVGTVYVVEWDARREAFATRILPPADFLASQYAGPDGPLLR